MRVRSEIWVSAIAESVGLLSGDSLLFNEVSIKYFIFEVISLVRDPSFFFQQL